MKYIVRIGKEVKPLIIDALKYRRYVPGWLAYTEFSLALNKVRGCHLPYCMAACYHKGILIAWATRQLRDIPVGWAFTTSQWRHKGISMRLQRLAKCKLPRNDIRRIRKEKHV